MPQLPDRQRSGFLQTEVPRATGPILEVGQQFDALAKLGGSIGNIAMDLQDKRNKAEDQQFLTNADTEDLVATNTFMREQRLKSVDGAGYTDAVTKFVSDRKAKNIENAPSDEAKMRYEASANNFFARSVVDASSYEREAKIKKMDFDMTNNVQARARAHIDTPNPSAALEDMRSLEEGYNGYVRSGVYDQLTGDKLKEDARNQITKSVLDGFYNRGGAGLQEGLNLMSPPKGQEESLFAQSLSPSEKQQYKHRFLQKIESDREANISRVIKKSSNTSERALGKGDVTESEFKAQFLANSRIRDPYKREEANEVLETAQFVQNKVNLVKGMKSDKLLESIKTVSDELMSGDKFTGFGKKAQMEAQYISVIKKAIEHRENHGADAAVDFDPELKRLKEQSEANPEAMRAYLDKSKLVQETMGIRSDQIRVTSDAKIAEMAAAINRAASPADVSARLAHYEQQFGEDFQRAFTEASKEEKQSILPEYLAVTVLADPYAREEIIKAIRDPLEINKRFEANKSGAKIDDVRHATAKALDPMIKALGGMPSNYGNGFLRAAQLEMKKMIGNGSSIKDASEEIKRKYYTDNFKSVHAGRAQVIFPNKKEYNTQFIADYIQKNTPFSSGSDDDIKALGARPTEAFMKSSMARGRTKEEAEANFYAQVKNSGKWITDPTMNGILFVTDEGNGKMAPVRGADGKHMFKSFSEISLKPVGPVKPPLKKMEGL